MDNENEKLNTDEGITKKPIFKILTIILVILLLVISIILGYRYFKSKQTGTETTGLFPTAGEVIDLITGNNTINTSTPTISSDSKFIELYKGPVGGYIKISDKNIVRLFDRNKGLLVDVDLSNGEQKNATDQPLLRVHDVTFTSETSMITRSYEDSVIKSVLYNFTQNQETGLLIQNGSPTFLSDNILEISKSLNNKYTVFVIKDISGSNIDLLNNETEEIKRLITLPISEWIPSVTNGGEVYLSSKASKYADSGTYKIVNGTLNIVVKALTAQTSIISPNEKSILSTSIYNKTIDSVIIKITNDSDYIISDNSPSIKTISDKCAWNNLDTIVVCGIPKDFGNNIPDEWYLGQIEYNDNIVKYDVVSGETSIIFNPELYDSKIDSVTLSINENNLFIKNKLNEHLFLYKMDDDLNAEKNYNVQNTDEIINSATTTE